jgi:hypothetical protein
MERRGDEVHVETTEASGGSKEGVVRWVLIIGTLLAIILLSAIWMTGAAFQGDVEEEATVSGQISSTEREGSSTDSIVGEDADRIEGAVPDSEAVADADADAAPEPVETN